MAQAVTLILHNARALTMDPLRPRAGAVAVAGERIAAVGADSEVLPLRSPRTRLVDCRGLTLIPGLNDAHCHLLSTASSLSALDCRPESVGSISHLLGAIRCRAAELPKGRWVRGFGLDPAQLNEGRFPILEELEYAAPEHPVRLDHASGHAVVLNRRGLEAAGIDALTPDPPDGVIDRDAATGEPTGVLYEMSAYLRRRIGSTRPPEELEQDVARLNEKLLAWGITSVQDAGPNNGLEQWRTFRSLTSNDILAPRLTMMAGARNLDQFLESGLRWGTGDNRLRLGHAKIMLTLTTGALQPGERDLAELASRCLAAGFPFAVHAVEREALGAALNLPQLFQTAAMAGPCPDGEALQVAPPPNRIEHASECPPDLMQRLAASGATVVTQPGFIYWRGDIYLQFVDPELLPHLYNFNEMRRRKITVAFSSDAPVIEPSPWPGIYASVTSRTVRGSILKRGRDSDNGKVESLPAALHSALSAYTRAGASAEGMERFKGSIRPGMLADLAVVDLDAAGEVPESILETRSRLTVVGGKVAWQDGLGE